MEVFPVSGAERLASEVQPETESNIICSLYPNPVKNQFTVQLCEPEGNPQTLIKDAASTEILNIKILAVCFKPRE